MWTPTWWWGVGGASPFARRRVLVAATAAEGKSQRRWRLAATPLVVLAGCVGVAVSFSTEAYTDTYNDPAVDYTAESIARGHKTFAENCVACHGPGGEGNGEMAKDLKAPPADLTAPHVGTHTIGDIFHWLTFGGQSGVMPSFKDVLDSDDRWDLINYLLILSSTNQSRFIGPKGMIQWLVAPEFQLVDPADQIGVLSALRGLPTLLSFARCHTPDIDETALESSLAAAHDAA